MPKAPSTVVPALFSSLVSAQAVLLVPSQYPTIQSAVTAAAPGDRIVLDPSLHTAGAIVDKALTIEAAPGGRAGILLSDSDAFGLRITALSGGCTRLRNLDVVAYTPDPRTSPIWPSVGLSVNLAAADSGVLVLDNCSFHGVYRNVAAGGPGARITTGSGVALTIRDCEFVGADGDEVAVAQGENGYTGSPGAIVSALGQCLVERCRFTGGNGGDSWWWGGWQGAALDGGAGLGIQAPLAALVACEVVDGDGGSLFATGGSTANPCTLVGLGGSSQLIVDAFDVTVSHGAAGYGAPACPGGQRPPIVFLGQGRLTLEATSPRQTAGGAYTIRVRVPPAAAGLVAIVYGLALDRVAVPGVAGQAYVSGVLFAQLVPGGAVGGWSTPPFPVVPATLDSELDVTLQTVAFDAATMGLELGSPATTTLFPVGRL